MKAHFVRETISLALSLLPPLPPSFSLFFLSTFSSFFPSFRCEPTRQPTIRTEPRVFFYVRDLSRFRREYRQSSRSLIIRQIEKKDIFIYLFKNNVHIYILARSVDINLIGFLQFKIVIFEKRKIVGK